MERIVSKRRRSGPPAVQLVGADALLPVPLDEAGEVAVPRLYGAVQPFRGVGLEEESTGGKKLDGADPQTVEIDDTPLAVPNPHAVVEVAGGQAVEVERGAALESHPHGGAAGFDTGNVAETRHEQPAQVHATLPPGDLEPEDLDRVALLRQPLGRHGSGPGILRLGAVEVVAPERLLAASPAQPPLVGDAVDGGDPAVEETRRILYGRVGWGLDRGSCRRGGWNFLVEDPIGGGENEQGDHKGERHAFHNGLTLGAPEDYSISSQTSPNS
jgi:hypothetical protein